MTISLKDVHAGKFFVYEYMVREIYRQDKDDNVHYYTYLLESGEPMHETSGMCSRRQITRWAAREATPSEISRMQTAEARKSEALYGFDLANEILSKMPDEMLLKEVRRRGLSIN